jgi:glycosyltransferase involved in cell wall biosynthesis
LPKQVVNGFFKQLVSAIRIGKKYGFSNRIVSISREGAAHFVASYPLWSKRVVAIPNGVDISLEEQSAEGRLQLDDQKFYVCFSGSLELKRKGQDLLMEAMALGICCISADCDTGPREIIENGENGLRNKSGCVSTLIPAS